MEVSEGSATATRSSAGQRLRSCVALFGLAVLTGVATGLLEGLVHWVNHAVRSRVVFVSEEVLWMAPAVYAMVFGLLGALMALAHAAVPRLMTSRVAAFGCVSFGVGCLLLPYSQIASYAAALLAAGVGAQAAHAAAKPVRYARGLAAFTGVLAILAAAAGATYAFGDATVSERSIPEEDAPNVLVVVWDVVRAQSLSVYGYGRPTTPGLEAMAAEAIVFDHAFSASPWTLPSHATLFTGELPSSLSTSWFSALDDAQPTIAEAMQSAGYRTGGFVGNHHYTSYDSGLGRGFDEYRDYRVSFAQLLRSSAFTQTLSISEFLSADNWSDRFRALASLNFYVAEKRSSDRKHAEDINAEFLEWLDREPERPFFAFLNHFDAHLPYWSPEGTEERFLSEDLAVQGYDAAISYLDEALSRLMVALSDRDILDNTIVIVTSDHGELFGENGLYGHAHNLYRPVLHVPLLVRFPVAGAGIRVANEVGLQDVPATILDLADIGNTRSIPGISLRRYWDGTEVVRDAPPGAAPRLLAEVEEGRNTDAGQPISRGPMKALIGDGYQFVVNGDGIEELYRYLEDPGQSRNLVDSPEYAEVLTDFREEMDRIAPGFRAARQSAGNGGPL